MASCTARLLRPTATAWIASRRCSRLDGVPLGLRHRRTRGRSTFYRVFRLEKEKLPSELMVRFEGVGGEFAQFDFGVADVRLLDGRTTSPPTG